MEDELIFLLTNDYYITILDYFFELDDFSEQEEYLSDEDFNRLNLYTL